MSRAAIVVAVLVILTGAILTVVVYRGGPTGDGQDALVIPFLIFWTVAGVVPVWGIDRIVQALWRYFVRTP